MAERDVETPGCDHPRRTARSITRAVSSGIRDGMRSGARTGGGARARATNARQHPVGNRGGVAFHFKMGQTGSVGAATDIRATSSATGPASHRSEASTKTTRNDAACGRHSAFDACREEAAFGSPKTPTTNSRNGSAAKLSTGGRRTDSSEHGASNRTTRAAVLEAENAKRETQRGQEVSGGHRRL